jgi:hypothetical protein
MQWQSRCPRLQVSTRAPAHSGRQIEGLSPFSTAQARLHSVPDELFRRDFLARGRLHDLLNQGRWQLYVFSRYSYIVLLLGKTSTLLTIVNIRKSLLVETEPVYFRDQQPSKGDFMAHAQRQEAANDEKQSSFSKYKPVAEVRHGNVKIAVWENEGSSGRFYTASASTISYKG